MRPTRLLITGHDKAHWITWTIENGRGDDMHMFTVDLFRNSITVLASFNYPNHCTSLVKQNSQHKLKFRSL